MNPAVFLADLHLTMNKAVKNLVDYCRIELAEALRMCSLLSCKGYGDGKSTWKNREGF